MAPSSGNSTGASELISGKRACTPALPAAVSLLSASAGLCLPQGCSGSHQEGRASYLTPAQVVMLRGGLPEVMESAKGEFESAPSLLGWLSLSIHFSGSACPRLCSARASLALHSIRGDLTHPTGHLLTEAQGPNCQQESSTE